MTLRVRTGIEQLRQFRVRVRVAPIERCGWGEIHVTYG